MKSLRLAVMTVFMIAFMQISPAYSQTVYTIKSGVNLRKGPDNSKRVLRTVAKGEVIQVLEKTNQWWWKVEYEGTTGYIAKDFIQVSYPLSAIGYIKAYPTWFGGAGLLIVIFFSFGRKKSSTSPPTKKKSTSAKKKTKK